MNNSTNVNGVNSLQAPSRTDAVTRNLRPSFVVEEANTREELEITSVENNNALLRTGGH